MGICRFIASDTHLPKFVPSQNCPFEINIDNAVIWNTPDKMYVGRPSFYCLTIKR